MTKLLVTLALLLIFPIQVLAGSYGGGAAGSGSSSGGTITIIEQESCDDVTTENAICISTENNKAYVYKNGRLIVIGITVVPGANDLLSRIFYGAVDEASAVQVCDQEESPVNCVKIWIDASTGGLVMGTTDGTRKTLQIRMQTGTDFKLYLADGNECWAVDEVTGLITFANQQDCGEETTAKIRRINSTLNNAPAIYLLADGGASSQLRLEASNSTRNDAVLIRAPNGGVEINTSGENIFLEGYATSKCLRIDGNGDIKTASGDCTAGDTDTNTDTNTITFRWSCTSAADTTSFMSNTSTCGGSETSGGTSGQRVGVTGTIVAIYAGNRASMTNGITFTYTARTNYTSDTAATCNYTGDGDADAVNNSCSATGLSIAVTPSTVLTLEQEQSSATAGFDTTVVLVVTVP